MTRRSTRRSPRRKAGGDVKVRQRLLNEDESAEQPSADEDESDDDESEDEVDQPVDEYTQMAAKLRPPQLTAGMKPQMVRNRHMEEDLEKQLVGIGFLNLLDPRFEYQFGAYNNRSLDTRHVKALRDNMKAEGIDKLARAVPVVMKKEYVKAGTVVPMDAKREDLKYIELTEEAIGSIIRVLGGHHRTEAMRLNAEELKKELKAKQNKYKPHVIKANKPGKALTRQLKLRDEIEQLQAQLKETGWLLVHIYEERECMQKQNRVRAH